MTPLLYDHPDSPNCRKVRLMLAALELPHETVRVDLPGGETRRKEFLAVNARGQIPVLVEGPLVLPESNAILAYLAARHAPGYLGRGASERAQITAWLFWQASGGTRPVATITYQRLVRPALGQPGDEAAVAAAMPAFRRMADLLEAALGGADFLERRLSVADLAVGTWLELADIAGLLDDHPALAAWVARLQALPFWSRAGGYELMARGRPPRAEAPPPQRRSA